ncbi:uncharacterized protein PODANS_2_14040 [Podospora anserina S mat+]|uniref:Podospora anserina S mat+ genomic DNA chromosome 2, supercontig 3 n=1 Tax=Podospora anserina (strain S / ATCC MYA-4624 / DSM 980 / FGSC 10383) TaxID=515849 RepID=B2AC31_PODAN|nr:uncharacterized protein PODANS_2_14040 [Podospora anserina S mat+]CAP61006.1 unnamed protein product [Podospora anserina S mat+]
MLLSSQAGKLIKRARQAPYGKGNETLVDTTVRNTRELGPTQFELRNTEWPGYLNDTCTEIGKELGIDAPIRAELYKMLIYEKGALFKPHTDTEKIPGMFGTIVICLPSAHEGGDVVATHCGQPQGLQNVRSRTIVHLLVFGRDTRGSTCHLRLSLSVYHILEYEYTEANVSLTALKNRDSAQARVLKDLSQQLPFQLFVALLGKARLSELHG